MLPPLRERSMDALPEGKDAFCRRNSTSFAGSATARCSSGLRCWKNWNTGWRALSAGVKQVVALSRGETPPDEEPAQSRERAVAEQRACAAGVFKAIRFPEVCGLLADLLQVSVESAPLVEVALGRFGTAGGRSGRHRYGFEYLKQNAYRFEGRVGFVWLDETDSHKIFSFEKAVLEKAGFEIFRQPRRISILNGRAGVLGRADQIRGSRSTLCRVWCKRLLGKRTWFVEKLADAVELAETNRLRLSFRDSWPVSCSTTTAQLRSARGRPRPG